MAGKRSADRSQVPEAVDQMTQMLDGALSEMAAGRRKSAGTLAIAGAVRAVDLICDVELGEHSTAASHRPALDLLATVGDSEPQLEDFSLCHSHKSDDNYHVSGIDDDEVREVVDAAQRLAAEALRRLRDAGWLPTSPELDST